jgi:RHS repeat-associated protein
LYLTKYYLGDYEDETDNLGNTRKIHYLSGGAILINNNGVETLYYGYSDYQGNLIALANEAGTVVENGRFAYDPWGKRRNPANWTQDDTRTNWIVSRGYTMHEHLDIFSIINMNGRVYDPLTAMFFSPDPFVQAPDNWLNYNRYSYVLNNPLKYTDPSGNWYIFPSVSYSYYGGLSVGISAGFGIPGGASVGGSVSYNFRQKNWTFTGNASFSGLYAYAGYDTKAGVVAGVGAGFSSFTAGNFSFASNLLGASVNYSGKGGMTLSMFGFNMGSDGIIFDPSITVSYSIKIDKSKSYYNERANEAIAQSLNEMLERINSSVSSMISSAEMPDMSTYRGQINEVVVTANRILKAEVTVTEQSNKINENKSYFQKALEMKGVPYKFGGNDFRGIDCSGLVNYATSNNNGRWTTSSGTPPGDWLRTNTSKLSINSFKKSIEVGNLLVWPGKHTAFFAGSDDMLFHAHGKAGTPTGFTSNKFSSPNGAGLNWWIINYGYPVVYSQR